MSKGGGNNHTTTTTEPPAWVRPIIEGAGSDIRNWTENNAGDLHNVANNLQNVTLPGLTGMMFDNSVLQPGRNYLDDVLGGHYLGQNNPYMNQMIQQTGQDVGNKVNATFSSAGRTAGGANQQLLTKGLADSENALRYQDYSNERNNMTQAAAQMPAYQAARFAGAAPVLNATQLAGQLPYYGANAMSGIGSLFGGYNTQRSETPNNGGSDIMGLIGTLGSAAIMASDRRLKKNIEKVGEASDGLGIYEWVYKFDPSETVNRGVMADEVEALRPWAFVPNFRGEYAGVNYAALGDLN